MRWLPSRTTATFDVETKAGWVRGRRHELSGAVMFGGIPYAEAPRGALRFASPVPRRPWTGVRDCTRPAPGALQRPGALARLIGMACPIQDEDCLHLTIWTPSVARDAGAGPRPVLFWIHGGGFEAGAPSNPLADGGRLAVRGDVVVVSVGYRLGALGFLCLDGVASNRGLLDQTEALVWVRENIAAFGGDPENVTIFGSSAGGTCVAALLATHGASGLFRRAIVQSGTAEGVLAPDQARATRRELLVQLGSFERSPARIRALLEAVPGERLAAAQRRTSDRLRREGILVPFQLALDEVTLPRIPLAAIHAGSAPNVALFVGTNEDELRLWLLGEAPPRIESEADLVAEISRILSTGNDVAAPIVARYLAERGRRPLLDVFLAIATDLYFRIPSIRLASAQSRHAPVFSYLFAWKSPLLGGRLGATHAIEIPFLFGTHERPRMALFLGVGPDRSALSERVQDTWSAFARRGDPSTGGFPWPRFDARTRATGVFDRGLARRSPAWNLEVEAWGGAWRTLFAVDDVDSVPIELSSSGRRTSIPPQMALDDYPASH